MATRQKIQIGVIIATIGLVLALAGNLIAYGRSDQKQADDIFSLQKEMSESKPKIDKVNVMENDILHIKQSTDETKRDVKILLMRGK